MHKKPSMIVSSIGEQVYSFGRWPSLTIEAQLKITELLPLKLHSLILDRRSFED